MFERFNESARAVVVGARHAAAEMGHEYVGSAHVLLALLAEPGLPSSILAAAGLDRAHVRRSVQQPGAATPLSAEDAAALRAIGIDPAEVLGRMERSFGAAAVASAWPNARRRRFGRRGPAVGRDVKNVLVLALREATALHHRYIGSEHLLLGLLREDDGDAARILRAAGVSAADVRDRVLAELRKAA